MHSWRVVVDGLRSGGVIRSWNGEAAAIRNQNCLKSAETCNGQTYLSERFLNKVDDPNHFLSVPFRKGPVALQLSGLVAAKALWIKEKRFGLISRLLWMQGGP